MGTWKQGSKVARRQAAPAIDAIESAVGSLNPRAKIACENRCEIMHAFKLKYPTPKYLLIKRKS
jgi:hypothetical protein